VRSASWSPPTSSPGRTRTCWTRSEDAMIVLVANLGSTSFKYKLFDMAAQERVLGTGAADRIGQGRSAWSVSVGERKSEGTTDLHDHAAAIDLHLAELIKHGAIHSIHDVQAIGFKAVHGGPISGAVR